MSHNILVICPGRKFIDFMQIRYMAMRLESCGDSDGINVITVDHALYGDDLLKDTRGIVFCGASPRGGWVSAIQKYVYLRETEKYRYRISRMLDKGQENDRFTKTELICADTVLTHDASFAEYLEKMSCKGNGLDIWVTPWNHPGYLSSMEAGGPTGHKVPTVLVLGDVGETLETEIYEAIKGTETVNFVTVNCNSSKLMRLNVANCANFGDCHPLAMFHVISAMHPDFIISEDPVMRSASVFQGVPVITSAKDLTRVFSNMPEYLKAIECQKELYAASVTAMDGSAQAQFIAIATETD